MQTWKRVLLRSVGFGAGVVLTFVIVAVLFRWWDSRPARVKPFDTHAVTCSFAGMEFQRRSDAFHFTLIYGLHNNSVRDYHLPSDGAVMLINAGNGGLDKKNDATWDTATLIPTGKTVNVSFNVPYQFSEYNYNASDFSEEKDVAFARHRANENKGLVFYDYEHRIEVDCPDEPAGEAIETVEGILHNPTSASPGFGWGDFAFQGLQLRSAGEAQTIVPCRRTLL